MKGSQKLIDSLVAIVPKFRTGTDEERQQLIDGLPLNLSAGVAAVRQRAKVLRDLPLDSGSFAARYGPNARCELVDGLREFCLGFHGESSDFQQSNELFYGFLSVLLVTFNGLHESAARRSEGGAADQGASRGPFTVRPMIARRPARF